MTEYEEEIKALEEALHTGKLTPQDFAFFKTGVLETYGIKEGELESTMPPIESSPPPLDDIPSVQNVLKIRVAVSGKEIGAFERDDVIRKIQSGEIKKDAKLWQKGMTDWVKAGEHPAFEDYFEEEPPPLVDEEAEKKRLEQERIAEKRRLEELRIQQERLAEEQRLERIKRKQNRIAEIKSKIGKFITFGNYNWRVLDVQDDKGLILSENIIEKRKYNEEYKDITWETCTLRRYLNSEFLRKFTSEQQGRIIETRIVNNDNLWYGTNGGNDTRDKIFLLSLDEADKYFGNSGDYQNKRRKDLREKKYIVASDGDFYSNIHDSKRIAKFEYKASWWLLRSPGSSSDNAAYVYEYGSVNVSGKATWSIDYSGVRPALWLKINEGFDSLLIWEDHNSSDW